MAFTKAPTQDTYSTHRLPVVYTLDFRQGAPLGNWASRTDAGMVNLLPRKVDSETFHAESRPPVIAEKVGNTTGANGVRGMYIWEKTAGSIYYYVVVDSNVYTASNVASNTFTSVNTLATSSGTVGFVEFIDSTNTKTLVLVDGTDGYVFTDNTAGTKIVDADFPTPHIPMPVFLNGRLYLAKSNTADIYNSDLDSPSTWTAGSFISSEVYPDDLTGIVKINNFLLAIGRKGSEYFYDAANATGSPLARQEGASLPFGTYYASSIASNANMLCMLTTSITGEVSLRVVEDFKHKEIECPWLSNMLQRVLAQGSSFAVNILSGRGLRGFFIRINGELLYCLRMPTTSVSLDSGAALFVYSFSSGVWTEFGYGSEGRCLNLLAAASGDIATPAQYVAGVDTTNGFAYVGIMGYGYLVGAYGDDFGIDWLDKPDVSANMLCQIRTKTTDFGTLNRKFMHRFAVAQTLNQSITPTLSLTCSDGDFSYTTTMDTSNLDDYDFPFVTQLGNFRRRSFKYNMSGDTYFRVKYFEVDINKGQQ